MMFKKSFLFVVAFVFLSGVTYAATMPVPTGWDSYTYEPIVHPVVSTDLSQAKPIGVGSVAEGGDMLSLYVGLSQLSGAVDVYFALYAPSIDPNNIYTLKSDNTFQLLSAVLEPWKGNTTGHIDEPLFGDIPTSLLPPGTYYLYLAVTPAFSLDTYYLWTTYFVIQRDGGGGGGNGATTYDFVTKWGSIGSGDGQFMVGPLSLAVDSLGYVYVGGGANGTTQKFTSDGIFVAKLSGGAMSIDKFDNMYTAGYSIEKFNSDGILLDTWSACGIGENQYLFATAIVADSSGNVYVIDEVRNRILKFTSNGTFITKWGSQGTGDGQLYVPIGIAVDSSNNVYVADYGNNRIQKFTSNGTFVTKWGSLGSGKGQFAGPKGIAVDSSNNVYVVEVGSNRIQKFTSNGSFITSWDAQDTGSRPSWVQGLLYIAVDSSGNVYVTENGGYYIQKFAPRK